MSFIDLTNLTKFGNMTAANRLGQIFDGNLTTSGYNELTSGFAGVVLAQPTKIAKAVFTPQSNGFDASGATSAVTLQLYGKNGMPANATDGTLLGSLSFTDVNSPASREITSTNQIAEFTHVWGRVVTGVWSVFAELQFYAVSSQPPLNEPVAFTGERYMTVSYCDTPVSIGHNLTEITPLRQTLRFNTPAALRLYARVDCRHMGHVTGYMDGLSMGSRISYRYGSTFQNMLNASFQYIDRALFARNLDERNPQHYATMLPSGVFQAQAGFYEFAVSINADTDRVGFTGTDGLASVLVEGTQGLNEFVIQVDHASAIYVV